MSKDTPEESIEEILSHELDPFAPRYEEAIIEAPPVFESIRKKQTALLSIDLQQMSVSTDTGLLASLEQYNIPESALDYYFDQMHSVVLPNVEKLMTAFRTNNCEVIHTRIQSLTKDGRDRCIGHKRLKIHAAPGSKYAEFLPQAAPLEDEIVLNKTASGVFSSTNIDYLLRNLNITGLFIVGVYSNECVSTAVREACDRGYSVTLIDDGCAAVTPEGHVTSIEVLKNRYARIVSTKEAIAELQELL